MGNKLGRRRAIVDERYTRPQGLYQHRDIDHRKLRRLILDSKLAPCYAGAEDPATDLDECPICFLHYPSLNRSKCCMKGICTECFLQMKSPHSVQQIQCPYCKTFNYAVEYRGVKSEEEKGIEQVEEQKVIEATIRMQQNELEEQQSTEGPFRTDDLRDGICTWEGSRSTQEDAVSTRASYQATNILPAGTESGERSAVSSLAYLQHHRDEFNLDLEDIMVMEAIWLSIQEQGHQIHLEQNSQAPLSGESPLDYISGQVQSADFSMEGHDSINNLGNEPERQSLTGGLAGVIAKLAEQRVTGNSSLGTARSLDLPDGFGSAATRSGSQFAGPTINVLEVEGLNEACKDPMIPSSSLDVDSDPSYRDNAKIRKSEVGGSIEQRALGDIPAHHCKSDDMENLGGNSCRYYDACPSSTSSQQLSDEAFGLSVEDARNIETQMCSTSGLASPILNEKGCSHPREGNGVTYVSKNFDEQMRLAMALSLAEAQNEKRVQLDEEGTSCI